MTSQRLKLVGLALVSSLALAGCFGSDEDVAPSPADPLAMLPDSAIQTAAGTVEYQQQLSKHASETREAIDVSEVVLPTSETAEPVAVD